jgi:hypothetical protein
MAAANPDTAVAAYEPKTIAIGNYDPKQFNLLIRGQSVVQSNPFLRPIVRTITLDQPGDTYPITQRKDGDDWVATEVGISAVGLANLADQAGIIDVPQASGRADDGRDPNHVTWRATGAMRMPDGQWIVRTRDCTVKLATVEKEIRTQKTARYEQSQTWKTGKWTKEKLEAEIAKELLLKEKFMERLAETGAVNRVTTALLGLRKKYTPAEIARPFVLMAVVPDMADPDIRQHAKEQAMLSIGAVFGGGGGSTQPLLSAGPTTDDLPDPAEIEGGELDPAELGSVAQVVEQDAAAAEAAAGDDDLPEFLRGGQVDAAAAADDGAAAEAEPGLALLASIRENAEASNQKGGVKSAQVDSLREIFTPLGGRAATAGLEALWEGLTFDDMTAAQAEAIIGVSRRYETADAFQSAWRAMAGVE